MTATATSRLVRREVAAIRRARTTVMASIVTFAVIAVAAMVLVQNTLTIDAIRDAQHAACERGNVLRRELSANNLILAAFLEQAADVRMISARLGRRALRPANETASRIYLRLRAELRPIAQVDCDRVVGR